MSRRLRSIVIAAVLGTALGAGAVVALAEPPKGGWAPDPAPIASKKQWVFEVATKGGKITVDRAQPKAVDKPTETPRAVGRFAIELWIGRELLDRVRFNPPGMGAEQPEGKRNGFPKPRFDDIVTRFSVRMADNPRAAYLLVIDRETGDTQKLFWPPEPDGRLKPWVNVISEAKPGDFPDGGVRAAGLRDGGAPAPDAGAADAGHD
jgi:hypothetical protein